MDSVLKLHSKIRELYHHLEALGDALEILEDTSSSNVISDSNLPSTKTIQYNPYKDSEVQTSCERLFDTATSLQKVIDVIDSSYGILSATPNATTDQATETTKNNIVNLRGFLDRILQSHNCLDGFKAITESIDLLAKDARQIIIYLALNGRSENGQLAMVFAKTIALNIHSPLSCSLHGSQKRLIRLFPTFNKALNECLLSWGVVSDHSREAQDFLRREVGHIWEFLLDIILETPSGQPILHGLPQTSWASNIPIPPFLRFRSETYLASDSPIQRALHALLVGHELVHDRHFIRLVTQLARHLGSDEYFSMDFFHNWIHNRVAFDYSLPIHNPSGAFKFVLDLRKLDVLNEALHEKQSLTDLIVLTGSYNVACASNVYKYASEMWPILGPLFLGHLDQLLKAYSSNPEETDSFDYIHTVEYPQGDSSDVCHYDIAVEQQHLSVGIRGAPDMIAECLQILAWLSAALSQYPHSEHVGRGRVNLKNTRRAYDNSIQTELSLTFLHIHEEGLCWLPLFSQAILAWGYPVPPRHSGFIGLEIELELLSALSGVKHAVEFRGGIVLKGASSILVPTGYSGDTIRWHLVTSDGDSRLTCNEAIQHVGKRILGDQLDLTTYVKYRHIVGWCSKAKVMLGRESIDYGSISYSGIPTAINTVRSAGRFIFGIQQIATAQVELSVGKRVGKYALRRNASYEKILRLANKAPIVLFDTSTKRGWLVSALDVILHAIQHAIYSKTSGDGKDDLLPFDETAWQTLLQHRDRFPVTSEDSLVNEISTIWNFIDYLIEINVEEERALEQPIRASLRNAIYGFEFMGLVEQASPIHRKKLHLQNTHGGWSDLVHDIDALVLFGKGFGDIMLPAEPLPCASWATMPQGHDFLASTVQMMLELYKKAGSKDQQYLTTRKLRWHRGESILFETCVPQSARCSCERLQRIVPSEVIGAVVGPGPLEEQGAVVFGERGRSVGFDVSRRVFNKLPWLQPRMNSTVNQNSRPNAVTEVSRPDSEEQHTNSFQLGSLVSLRSLVDRFSRFLKA